MYSSLEKRGFEFGQRIGQGSSSVVVRAKKTDENGTVVELACKIVNKITVSSDFLTKFFPRELELLTKTKHPNVIGIYGILESKNLVFIFQRYAENGNLLDKVRSLENVEENLARIWTRQIVSGVSYLHSIFYAHRDLKCENIFISRNNNVKIGDFGFARNVMKDNMKILSQTFCGSKLYAAPEILQMIPYDPLKSDVFSIGVIVYIMITGFMPFTESNIGKLVRFQLERRYNRNEKILVTQNCWDCLDALLEPDATIRVTIKEASQLNWLKQ